MNFPLLAREPAAAPLPWPNSPAEITAGTIAARRVDMDRAGEVQGDLMRALTALRERHARYERLAGTSDPECDLSEVARAMAGVVVLARAIAVLEPEVQRTLDGYESIRRDYNVQLSRLWALREQLQGRARRENSPGGSFASDEQLRDQVRSLIGYVPDA